MVGKILKKTKSILFANPRTLLKDEREVVNKPYYFKGNNGKAVLLLHGWTSTPYELRRLARYLNESGYTVFGPLLKGHGTVYTDLENVNYADWLKDASTAYKKLREDHNQVFVGGTSMGASLALCLAKERKDIDGLILMAAPYKIRYEKLVELTARFLSLFKKYHNKFYPFTFGSRRTITRVISYQRYPISSVLELMKLINFSRKNLNKIEQPCIIMQSSSDHIIAKKSLKKIYDGINSRKKAKKYIKRSYHTFVSDIKSEHVFEEILKFIKSI